MDSRLSHRNDFNDSKIVSGDRRADKNVFLGYGVRMVNRIVVALSVFPAIKCVCVGGCGWVGVWVGVYWVSNPAVLAEIFNSLWLTCCYISAVRRESII